MQRDLLGELRSLWETASASDRVGFLSHVVSGHAPALAGYPEHDAPPPWVIVFPDRVLGLPEDTVVVRVEFVEGSEQMPAREGHRA